MNAVIYIMNMLSIFTAWLSFRIGSIGSFGKFYFLNQVGEHIVFWEREVKLPGSICPEKKMCCAKNVKKWF